MSELIARIDKSDKDDIRINLSDFKWEKSMEEHIMLRVKQRSKV